ncbi:MAG: hypothetical protein ACI3YI_00410 [Bacteroidaceae bacterium]
MDSKIQELTDKLLNEGVEKGKEKAQEIISQAKEQAEKIINEAKQQAEDIKVEADKDAKALDHNTKAELKMFCGQAVSALKTEIADIVTDNVVKQAVKEVVDDKKFMQEFMLKLAEKWGAQEDIVISAQDAEALKAVFAKKAKTLLDKSVKIQQVNGKDTLFTVEPADGAYKVNFGNEEFEDYFKSFLRPQLVEMLF